MIWNTKWFPGTNLQDLNLDWILKKIAALRGGTAGQYLYKKSNMDFDFGWKTGSGGGTSDYLDLDNKPYINNVELTGNKTAYDLGLATLSDIPVVPVQSVNGKTGTVVLSASDVGAYVKPADGIPKTDLSSVVQTSLDKADTALQAVPPTYRTAAAQDTIDAAQDAQIDASAKANEIAIVIMGARPSNTVTEGQYVIVRDSTINGITDGLYKANAVLSPSIDVTSAKLTAATTGGLNSLFDIIKFPIVRTVVAPSAQVQAGSTTAFTATIPEISGYTPYVVSGHITNTDVSSYAFTAVIWTQSGYTINAHVGYSGSSGYIAPAPRFEVLYIPN